MGEVLERIIEGKFKVVLYFVWGVCVFMSDGWIVCNMFVVFI